MIKNFEKFDTILNMTGDEISNIVLGVTPDAASLLKLITDAFENVITVGNQLIQTVSEMEESVIELRLLIDQYSPDIEASVKSMLQYLGSIKKKVGYLIENFRGSKNIIGVIDPLVDSIKGQVTEKSLEIAKLKEYLNTKKDLDGGYMVQTASGCISYIEDTIKKRINQEVLIENLSKLRDYHDKISCYREQLKVTISQVEYNFEKYKYQINDF